MNQDSRREIVERFLRRCVKYADESIRRKRQRGDSEEEISKWVAYRDFTAHAVDEVASGDLDSWLEDGPVSYDPET
ncbi:MAG: hypothetical protein CMB53_05320 [Euryarchaeota archaeon]|nr:hypothetical protein [Euryarchaeota archaeon]|tara:strand:- start:4686 stop:4913 length:228 start_codon:yes stop_codon:yes gene_type:complete